MGLDNKQQQKMFFLQTKNNDDNAPPVVEQTAVMKGTSKFKKPTVEQLKAFIQLRIEVTSYKGRSPLYKSLTNCAKNNLIDLAIKYKAVPVQPRIFNQPITLTPTRTTAPDNLE